MVESVSIRRDGSGWASWVGLEPTDIRLIRQVAPHPLSRSSPGACRQTAPTRTWLHWGLGRLPKEAHRPSESPVRSHPARPHSMSSLPAPMMTTTRACGMPLYEARARRHRAWHSVAATLDDTHTTPVSIWCQFWVELGRAEVDLGPIQVKLGVNLGGRSGADLGSIWGGSGVDPRPIWGRVGVDMGPMTPPGVIKCTPAL